MKLKRTGSYILKSESEGSDGKSDVPYWTSCRVLLSFISFLGFAFVYIVRINFTMAIVCMVRKANATSNITQQNSTDDCTIVASQADTYPGEFDWSRSLQGYMLSSFFYGYIVTQLPAGILADKFGGKHLFGGGMLITVIAMVLIPVGARAHVSIVFICRVIMGMGTGVVFPAMHSLWGRWAPPLERSRLMAFCYSGTIVGNILALSTSGLLCATRVDGGWPMIFYVFGIATFLWIILWYMFVYDSPGKHPRIKEVEKVYIEESVGRYEDKNEPPTIPWIKMAKSPPLWAIIAAHLCNNWGNYTLLTSLPLYMKDVLKFDIQSNGLLSALPYICMWVFSNVCGFVADALRQRYIFTTGTTRKIFQIIAFTGPAVFMIATGFMDCDRRYAAVAFLTLGVTFTGAGRSAYLVNHVDIAPRFAGVLFGITNTAASLPGIFAPMVVGAITTNGTAAEWRVVFFICAGVYLTGLLIFLLFAKGEEQEWAKGQREEKINYVFDLGPVNLDKNNPGFENSVKAHEY